MRIGFTLAAWRALRRFAGDPQLGQTVDNTLRGA